MGGNDTPTVEHGLVAIKFYVAGDKKIEQAVVIVVSQVGPVDQPPSATPAFSATSVKVPSWLLW